MNGITTAASPMLTKGSMIAVVTCTAMNRTDSRDRLRCSPVTAKDGSPGSRPCRLTRMPSITTRDTSRRLTAPIARVRSHVGGVLVNTGPLRRHPGFRRLWTGQVVAAVGSQLTVVAVGYQTYRLTGSTAMVGLVSLGQLVPLLAGSVLGGPAV